ncbi:MAG: class I tRNA ligase family protein, partial [Myxococcota bacterium]
EEQLPLLLPEIESYKPTGTGEPPLAKATEWVETTHPVTQEPARRETNTMPQWAGSCWYYLRYIDPHNDQAPWDPDKERYWMPVDLYVGGAEHAVLHLLYARFWHKVLYDIGVVSTPEPFQRLINQGMILGFTYRYYEDTEAGVPYPHTQAETTGDGIRHTETKVPLEIRYAAPDAVVKNEDGSAFHPDHPELRLEVLTEKMSKSRGNVVNPDTIINAYGADSLRLYEMYMGPLENVKPWNTDDIIGLHRFLGRVWRLIINRETGAISDRLADVQPDRDALRAFHQCIQKVTEDTEAMRFNTAIAAMIAFTNTMYKMDAVPRSFIKPFLVLLSPYAPHIAEELWHRLGHPSSMANTPWPEFDAELAAEETIELPIQVNGKVRATLTIAPNASKEDVLAMAKSHERIQELTEGKRIVREIFVPGRIINLVVK